MKTPLLLFSLPLLATVLAAQSLPPGGMEDEIPLAPGIGTSLLQYGISAETSTAVNPGQVSQGTTPADSGYLPSVRPFDENNPTGIEEMLDGLPDVASAPCETRSLVIRGRRMNMDILTDRIHIRPKLGKEYVRHLPDMADLQAVDMASTVHDLSGVERADLIAYPRGRARTDVNKLLLTRSICVKLADGVVFSVFAKNSGAVFAERPHFAEEAIILTYVTGLEALDAVERLRRAPGVLDAYIIVASKRKPEFLSGATYFSGGGPAYSPVPLTDNVDGWAPPTYLSGIIGTTAYQWWANNRTNIPVPEPLLLIPTEPFPPGALINGAPGAPINAFSGVTYCRIDLGDFAPIRYNNATTPKFQGEMSDIRLPLAWENTGDFDMPISGRMRKVLIIDDGLERTHGDLFNAVDLNPQRHWNYMTFPESASPLPLDTNTDTHGTSLAGIVGARIKPTGSRISGVAPGCTFHAVVVQSGFVDDFKWADAFAFAAPPATPSGPPEGNNRGTIKDLDKDNNFLDEERTGIVAFEIALNASAGPGSGDGQDLYPEDWLWKRAIRFSATRGRGLAGVPFITSTGNGGSGHMDGNYLEQKNSIYQIPVGGVSELGRGIAYSAPSAALVCVAPTWGWELPPYLNWPTAPGGWPSNRPIKKDPPIGPDDLPPPWRRITQGIPTIRTNNAIEFNFNGTSASAAQVAGIVALMLEANDKLQARDVKEILMRCSRVCGDVRVDTGDTLSAFDDDILRDEVIPIRIGNQTHQVKTGQLWRMSPLGRPVHPRFGFGLVDADRAIKIARSWPNLPVNPLPPIKQNVEATDFGSTIAKRNTETGGLYFPVTRGGLIPTNGANLDIDVPGPPAGMRIEHIEVRVRLYHKRRGDLEIKLIAPGEVGWEEGRTLESELYVPHREDYTESRYSLTNPELRDPTDWTFTTVRHWGTRVKGTGGGVWKVRFRDAVSQGATFNPTAEDPVYCPVDNPTDGQSQRIEGVAVTYHGTYGTNPGNDPPTVIAGSLRFDPGVNPVRAQLNHGPLGVNQVTGQVIFPVTNWDFWKGEIPRRFDTGTAITYTPLQPSNAPVDYFEFFPPAVRDPVDPNVFVPIDPLFWPRQPFSPAWISFLLDPAARPATWPAPPVDGPVGGLTQRPNWTELTQDNLWLVIRDANNTNQDTNWIAMRLNRSNGQLDVIPVNRGRYLIDVYCENMIGISQPKNIQITVAPPGYGTWADIWWDPPDLSDPAWEGPVSGWLADPDLDGIANGLEYAMRLNPTVPDPGPVPAYRVEGNEVVFSFSHDTTASDAALHAQVSEDLITWTDVQPTIVGVSNGISDNEYRLPLQGDVRLYFRLWSDNIRVPNNP